METLIIHPTATAQWQALVSEAELLSAIKLSEELESYLVFLLMRFSESPEVVHSIIAEELIENLNQLNKLKYDKNGALRDIGDKCLLLSGLFPGNARRRRVRISYYVKLGQSAYHSLSDAYANKLATLFCELSSHFIGLMDILHTIRSLTSEQMALDLLQAEELWSDTHSAYALKTLRGKTDGFILSSSLIDPNTAPNKLQ